MATVLIVDDEEDLRLLMRLSLRSEPYKILEASTGAEAAELWTSADLILLDIRLPDIDGLDLMRRFGHASAPVLAVSAHSVTDVRSAALDAGCVAYLTKPFTPTELINAIRENLPAA